VRKTLVLEAVHQANPLGGKSSRMRSASLPGRKSLGEWVRQISNYSILS